MQSSSVSINLVKTKVNFAEEIVKWALTVGRLLIILTELVAFSTFVYRFSLDRTLIDIRSEVTQQQALVASLKTREETYRNLQERMSLAKKAGDEGKASLTILSEVYSLGNQNITFNSLSKNGNQIIVDATTNAVTSFSTFSNALRDHPRIDTVNIDSIESKGDTDLINFSLTATIKKQQ